MNSALLGGAPDLAELSVRPFGTANTRTNLVRARALPFVLALSGILWLGPSWAWDNPLYFRVSVACVGLCFALMLVVARTDFVPRNVALAVGLLSLFTYYGAHRFGGPFVLSTGWLVLLVFVLVDDEIKSRTLDYFALMLAITLIPSVIILVLSALGVNVPYRELSTSRFDSDILLGNEPGFYRAYPGAVVLNDQVIPVGRGSIFRLQGVYDEPGVVGTSTALLLIARGVRLRRDIVNKVLLIAGALSFSAAFYALMLIYGLLRRPLITIAATATALVLILSTALANASVVQLYVLSRFTMTGGRLLADNRVSTLFTALYEDFWNADLVTRLFGASHDVTILVNTGSFSYKVIIYAYGVFGFALLLAYLTVGTLSVLRTRAALTLLVVFLASIYQRPDALALPYLIGLLGGVAALRLGCGAPSARLPRTGILA